MNRLSNRDATIVQRVRNAREDAGLSQGELAEHLGLTRAGYGHYERGRNVYTVEQLFQLSRVLGRSVEWFLGLDTDLADDEDQLLTAYRTIKDDAGKGLALRLLKDMASVE